MSQFSTETVAVMRDALAGVCSHIPERSPDARTLIASKSWNALIRRENGLLQAGRRAVIERFGTVNAVRAHSDE